MAGTPAPNPTPVYKITQIEAARILGVPRQAVARLVKAGRLGVQKVPGTWPRLSLEQVEDLARRARTEPR